MFAADIWCQASGLDCSKGIKAHGAECLCVRITLLHPSKLLSIAQHEDVCARIHTHSRTDTNAQKQTYSICIQITSVDLLK